MRRTLPAYEAAVGWLNTSLAASEDEERPVLYRSVLVEMYPHGVQLVSTDSYMLLGTFIANDSADLDPPPGFDVMPDEAFVVLDPDKRMNALMRYVHGAARAAAKNGLTLDLTVSVESGEKPDTPTLDPSLDRHAFVVEAERERLSLPIYEGEFPTWRSLIAPHKAKPTAGMALAPALLARLGKIKGADAVPVQFSFADKLGPNLLSVACEPPLFGLVMPVRTA